MAADADPGEWDVGGGDPELLGRLVRALFFGSRRAVVVGGTYVFASPAKAFYDWAPELEWEGRLRCVWAGDGVAGPVWAAFCHFEDGM